MVGIIMAAMFSATMAMVSADYNAIASVLTKDVYHRLIHPAADERRLLAVGRWSTLGLGVLTTLLSLWIAFTRTQSLFNIMVTVLGLFMAPTFLPLLAGLSVRWITWKGAFAGFLCGLSTGLVMLGLKTWYFTGNYQFEGISLLMNAAMTIVGMVVFSRGPAHSEKFFEAIDTPISDAELPKKGANPAGPVLGVSTIAVGALLAVAGIFSGSVLARIIDLSVAALLVLIGLLFRRGKAS
jgi:Na+/proline symporter